MRFLRFLVLVAALLAVYAAQYLFDQSSLDFLRTPWVSTNLPFLWDFSQWAAADRQSLGLYLAGIGALLFGLAVYGWPRASEPDDSPSSPRRSSAFGLILAVAGIVGGALLLVYFQQNETEPAWSRYLWIFAIAVYILGSWLADGVGLSTASAATPERSWPTLLLILAVVGLLLGWQLATVPVRVDGDEGSHGLQALEIAAGLEERIFAPGWANIPLIAYYPAALGMTFSGDWLLGNRLAGLYAGLLTILGVWLLGCELFRRTPTDEDGADDGRLLALLAAAFTGIGYTFVHFGRMPQYLEPVAWGVLGLWALQRGVRTGSRPTLALAGLLLGLTATLYYSGRVFGVIALLWWLWFVLARRGWLRRVGWDGFALWVGGNFVFLAPFVGGWLRSPSAFYDRFQVVSVFNPDGLIHLQGVYGVQGIGPVLLENTRRALLTFWIFGDKSTHFGFSGPLLDSLIGPLLLLGVGYLLLNLDRLQSWQLVSWLAAVVVLGGVLTVNTPYWPRLLPALPVAGLICALAVDRARSTLIQAGAPWFGQFSLFVVIGLLVLAGSHNWVDWYETQTVYGDSESYAGRAIRSLPAERTAVLIDTGSDLRGEWGERTLEFLAGGPYARRRATIHTDNWPVNLPPQSSVILQPDDQALAAELQSRYPGGVFLLQRNRAGDPVLFVYQLP
ncbi:MAG: hypothetical protein DWI57_17480 [Chloroflexi bacterium]|nr:MAG: hypothetical protein DWI57_17480 [Chloroflexota bacterium]